jgi:hypothetical protein
LRKLQQSLANPGHTKLRGYLLGGGRVDSIPEVARLPKPEPTWPKPDLDKIDEIVTQGIRLCDLWNAARFISMTARVMPKR